MRPGQPTVERQRQICDMAGGIETKRDAIIADGDPEAVIVCDGNVIERSETPLRRNAVPFGVGRMLAALCKYNLDAFGTPRRLRIRC